MTSELDWLESVLDVVRSQIRTLELILNAEKNKEGLEDAEIFTKHVCTINFKLKDINMNNTCTYRKFYKLHCES